MSASKTRREGFGILGVGAAACVACCAGAILAFVGGVSLAGLASILLSGAAGLVVAAVAPLALIVRRRRRRTCPVEDGPVSVAAPARRVSS